MSTSANRINYEILKAGELVGSHSQHIMTGTCHDGLEKFIPYKDHTILPWGYDEEGEEWTGEEMNLLEWMKKNPAQVTHRDFEVGSIVDLNKKRGTVRIIKVIKENRKFVTEYLVENSSNERFEVSQYEIRPIQKILI